MSCDTLTCHVVSLGFYFRLHRADVDLGIEEFNVIGSRVPLLANLKPHGKVC